MKNIKKFFTTSALYGDGEGFGRFSAAHLIYAALCLLICLALRHAYMSACAVGRKRLRLGLGAALAALSATRAALLLINGDYGLGTLPLHLCGMAVYMVLLHSLRGGRLLGQLLYAFCLPGAAAALIFPNWGCFAPWSFMSLCSFLLHGGIIAYVLMLSGAGEIRQEAKLLPLCFGIMLAVALAVYLFDLAAGTNYMFLNWPEKDTPLELFSFLGRPGYILGYLPLLAAVWVAMYGLPAIKKARTDKKSVR